MNENYGLERLKIQDNDEIKANRQTRQAEMLPKF